MNEKTAQEADSSNQWVTYRPDIKILDCTVRDGGLINDHAFDDAFVKAVYEADVAAGIDYIEFGYKASKAIYSQSKFGPWKFCDEDALRRVVGENATNLKISVMADAERTDYHTDILPKDQSVIDSIRVACYIHQIPLAMDMVQDAHDKGYETMMQLMAVSVVNTHEVQSALDIIAKSPAAGVYIVDSFGALYSEQIRDYTRMYVAAMAGTGKDVGIHAHNNQQLAFANTIEAIIGGANRVDATMAGIGRGAGNCPMELIMGFLHNPKFKMRPLLECTQHTLMPLRAKMDWGYSIPYAITGQLNQHPRTAIQWRESDRCDDYVGFYDQIIEEDS
jgi:4-hydroxy 2-oxovalerate aldolase